MTSSEIVEMTEVSAATKWCILANTQSVEEMIKLHSSIILCKPVQSGKTSDVFKIVEKTYQHSITIFVSDKNSALAGQTNVRAKSCGFTVINFSAVTSKQQIMLLKEIKVSCGKKKIFHFLMEKNNLDILETVLLTTNQPVTLVIDEADKNRNVSEYVAKDEDSDEDDDDAGGNTLPVITRSLLAMKNLLKSRNNGSKVVFVSATPQSLLVSEEDDDRLVIYKKPYNNYIGAGIDHHPDVELHNAIRYCDLPTSVRWSRSAADVAGNTFADGVKIATDLFKRMGTKDPSVKQIMLISLESRNIAQNRMAKFLREEILTEDDNIGVVVFNGTNKTIKGLLLSDIISCRLERKIIIIAGFMASRGVSFTDFSDHNNKFELCVQVHNTKPQDPLNSAAQAMRIFGPARRTIDKPVMVCNKICYEDLKYNFVESYRVVRDLAQGKTDIERGDYDTRRPLTQPYNFRYMKQTAGGKTLLYRSYDKADWEPICTL